MSDNAWNKIPEDLREPFLAAVKRGYEAQRQYLVDANEEATEKLKGVGVVFHDIDNSALQAAYQKAAAEKGWKFDPAWQAAVDQTIATVK